jgi:EmrB/QacA subfamily drug resistance transporter
VSNPALTVPVAQRTAPIISVLLLAGMAYALSQTMVFPALPSIGDHFDAGPQATSWVLTAFFLSASVATPIFGKLGDLYGKDRVLPIVLALLCIGSVMCALAPSIGWLIAGRAISGAAGGIFPLAFGIIRETFPPERVSTAIGGISATFGIGGGVGLVIAGLIVEALDASWLFWLGLMALPAAFAIHRYVPREETRKDAKVDWLGAALLSVSLASLLYGLSKANAWGWGDPRTLTLIVGGLAMAVFWGWVETKIPQPLVDMRVLRRRPVLMTNITAVLIGFSMFASFLLIPQLAQTPESTGYGFGASVTGAGLLMLPSTLIMLVAGPWAGRIAVRANSRLPLVLGAGFGALAFAFYAVAHTEVWQIALGGVLLGIGIGFSFSAMANLVVEAVPRDEVGVATGINTIMRSLGGALGAQLVATLLTTQTVGNPPIPTEAAYTDAFIVAAIAAALAVVAALMIPVVRRPQPVTAPAPA